MASEEVCELKYEHLVIAQADLVQRYIEYIPQLSHRAKFDPAFNSVRIVSTSTYPVVHVNICERLLRNTPWSQDRWLYLRYIVYPSGFVALAKPATFEYLGAETAYMDPVKEWVAAIKGPLELTASKARINARARALKEELVVAVWKPARVAALLERGGWDLIDALI